MTTFIKGKVIYSVFRENEGELVHVSYDPSRYTLNQAIEVVLEDEDGKLWAISPGNYDELATQINFCPFTGTPAKIKRDDYVE